MLAYVHLGHGHVRQTLMSYGLQPLSLLPFLSQRFSKDTTLSDTYKAPALLQDAFHS